MAAKRKAINFREDEQDKAVAELTRAGIGAPAIARSVGYTVHQVRRRVRLSGESWYWHRIGVSEKAQALLRSIEFKLGQIKAVVAGGRRIRRGATMRGGLLISVRDLRVGDTVTLPDTTSPFMDMRVIHVDPTMGVTLRRPYVTIDPDGTVVIDAEPVFFHRDDTRPKLLLERV